MKTFLAEVLLVLLSSTAFGNGLPDQAPPVGSAQTFEVSDTTPKPMPKQYATRSVVTGYQQQCVNDVCSLVPIVTTETYEVDNAASDPVASKKKDAAAVAPAAASVASAEPVERHYLFSRLHSAAEAFANRPKLFDGRFVKWFRGARGGCSCAGCGN